MVLNTPNVLSRVRVSGAIRFVFDALSKATEANKRANADVCDVLVKLRERRDSADLISKQQVFFDQAGQLVFGRLGTIWHLDRTGSTISMVSGGVL